MNLFTENQVNQVYVVTNGIKDSHLTKADADKGKIYMGKTNPDASPFMNESIYFEHSGPGGITRSDNIDLDKIMYVHATPADEMKINLMEYMVLLSEAAMDGDYVIPGKDYILRIELTNYMGVSPEDSHYWKYGMVHTTANMTPAMFYKELAKSIIRNMSREAVKFLQVFSGEGGGEVTLDNIETLEFGSSGLSLKEVEPDWILGLKRQKVIHFNLTGIPFDNDGETIFWLEGENEETELKPFTSGIVGAGALPNSKLAADYEYFFHGERGDQYRMVGWPDYIPTQYMVDSNNRYGYDFVQIHYYYTGPNEGAQKSEKDITFLVPRAVKDGNNLSVTADNIVNAVQAAIDAKATTVANNAISDAVKAGTIAAGGGN